MKKWTFNADVLEMVCRHLDFRTIVALSGTNKAIRSQFADMRLRINHPIFFRPPSEYTPSILCKMDCRQRVFKTPHYVRCLAWSPCSTKVVYGTYDRQFVRIVHVQTGKELQRIKTSSQSMGLVLHVQYSPDGTKLVCLVDDPRISIHNVLTGQVLHQVPDLTGIVWIVRWSPDGERLAFAMEDQTVRIWDVTKRNLLKLLGHSNAVRSVAWSPDGTRIVSGSEDTTARIWDATTGQALLSLQGHKVQITSVDWCLDGTKIVSGSNDRTLRIWDAVTGQTMRVLQGYTGCSVGWSPDGSKVVSGSCNTKVRIWDATTGKRLQVMLDHTHHVVMVAWSPDGTHIASGSWDDTIRIWNVDLLSSK